MARRGRQNSGSNSRKGQGRQRATYATNRMNKCNSSKRQRRDAESVDALEDNISKSNPVQLYNKYTQFAQDAGKLSFSTPVGEFINFGAGGSAASYASPGIMRIRFTPAIGVSKDFTSPVNRSSIKFWTYLRSIQKASSDYNHQDITMMMLALDSAVCFHSLMRRVYGLLTDVTPQNKYYPRALVAASGFSFDDLITHISDFRSYINEFAYLMEQYAIPKNVTLLERHQWMCEGIYTDSQSAKAQTYIFVPNGFWQYDNTVETGSQLTYKGWISAGAAGTQAHTFAEVVAFGNSLINAMSGDEDFGYISGDMYVFYNGDTFKVPYTDETYRILPSYDETVLSQIENATLVGELVNDETSPLVITQNPNVNAGAILFQPLAAHAPESENILMNFHWDSPSSDQVLEASRLITTLADGSGSGYLALKSCGTEIITEVDVFTRNIATGKYRFNPVPYQTVNVNVTTTTVVEALNIIADMSNLQAFDWAPRLTVYEQTGDTGQNLSVVGTTWDLDNVSEVSNSQIANLNTAALMSLFWIE